jgi:hypothetical protein
LIGVYLDDKSYSKGIKKMDIELEKEKASYIHKLEIRKLIVDKLFLGFILFALGFTANFFLEHYKSQSTKERFILEKRLEAVQKISQTYMNMHNAFDAITLKQSMSDKDKKRLEEVTQKYINDWTEWAIILSKKYRRELDYVTWIYIGLGSQDLDKMKAYRGYLIDLYYKFNAMCQEELGFLSETEITAVQFVEWPASKADALGAQAFLEANYKQWLHSKPG